MFLRFRMEERLHRSRLSLNQITTPRWSVVQATQACVRREIPSIALWRHKIAEQGLHASVRAVRDAGMRVSSVCRGGMLPAVNADERRKRIEDNFGAIDEAAALNADVLVMVVGGASPMGIRSARTMVREGIAELVPYAKSAGVRLGLEPLHPMFAGDRSVLTTISEALGIAQNYPAADVGVILDVYHIWWDPCVSQQIEACAGRIFGFHVSDWLVPLPDVLTGRGMLGEGAIDLRSLRETVDRAGYVGPIEVEILNQTLWDEDPDSVLDRLVRRFEQLV